VGVCAVTQDGGTRVMVQEAITQAINEVFLSLVKISIFHALWTWLTLTILGVRIVYISTFLTLLFVIFPVIGTHLPSHHRTHASSHTRHDTQHDTQHDTTRHNTR
jgi:Na+-transporting methylmalonyl-CoA/oxaloacetate decarboxylase gamma subunit